MRNLKLFFLVASLAMTISCAQEKKSSGASAPEVQVPPAGTPWVPEGTGPGQNPGTQYGGTAALTIPNLAVFGQYTGRPMNNPTEIKINLNMVKTDGGTFGGTATITYKDNGYYYKGYFTTGSTAKATQYNKVFSYGGKTVWHGIFEDFMGGLVVVIDEIVDLGDGGGSEDLVNGTVWFKNFGLTYAPHPPTYCWFVSLGPYDCRAWPSGTGMNTYAHKDPQNGYIKLGSFTGLSIKAAFNNEPLL